MQVLCHAYKLGLIGRKRPICGVAAPQGVYGPGFRRYSLHLEPLRPINPNL